MNIFEAFLNVLAQVWYLVPLLLIVSVFKSRWLKGAFGELKYGGDKRDGISRRWFSVKSKVWGLFRLSLVGLRLSQ